MSIESIEARNVVIYEINVVVLRLAVRLQSSGLPCGTTTQLNKEQNLA
jgi:hypothetical protein